MAAILLGGIGSALGAGFGGTFLGLSGAVIGGGIGSLIGTGIDSRIISSFTPDQRQEGARLDELRVTSATEGAVIPRVYGRMRVGGNIIWATDFREVYSETRQGGGGKGGGGGVVVEEYSYFASIAVAIATGPIGGIGRIWADGSAFDVPGAVWRLHRGTETQMPDPFIEATMGAGLAHAYRGTAYIVFENLPLATFGNRLPQLSFEVYRPSEEPDSAEQLLTAVNMIPSSGEFIYATEPITRTVSGGAALPENVNSTGGQCDFLTSLDQLEATAPNCKSVSLVLAWFGTDLRAGSCQIRPGVETATKVTTPKVWLVNGVARSAAYVVSQTGGSPAYGGTPSDFSVVQAIQELKARGFRVTFYPFLLMDVPEANALPNPYSNNAAALGQPKYPWRGRITCSPAAGFAGTVDKTAAAAGQVSAFFGTAVPGNFVVSGTSVSWTGSPSDWGLRRMMLHYAHLCVAAGGVDAFLIGSELRGLTQVRSGASAYPAVTALQGLAAACRSVLGSGTKISYAADWSEYFGHQPQDGTNDLFFHLDPLWADASTDFVGIDNYMPLSDWRDGDQHLDALAGWPALYDLPYLQSNIEGGEGFDWFYATVGNRTAQIRTPITDGAYGKPWVFRTKDLRSWWTSQHFNRPGGVQSGSPTPWVPQSKPIRFTEAGAPAVDRGTNQPNVFYDPKSSESFLPYFSRGYQDDLVQRRYIEALYHYWNDPAKNPASGHYAGRMIDAAEIAIWTWDARPYPAFPVRSDVWSDIENYRLGHWLTGRIGGCGLAELVRELCRTGGVRAAPRKSGEPVQVVSYRHGETRVNNPEVGMVHAGTDPDGAKTIWAYDPHLDPVLNFDSARAGVEKLIDDALASGEAQAMKDALLELKRMQAPYLTWTGKAERTSFQVDTVSLHVHERVDPATILAAAARRLKGKDAPAQWRQPDLFAAPFENLPLRQALDFYHHEKGWSNRLVSGDSLLVMNSLLTKESMGGKVQMIYINPPYGIKYGSNFQPFTNKRDVKDRSDADLTQEPEMIKAFRDTWELGIHSYLTYLRDRLVLARDLLHESGSVFVQISDENVHHVREVMDEIFGTANFCSEIVYRKTAAVSSPDAKVKILAAVADIILWYGRDRSKTKYNQLYLEKSIETDAAGVYVKGQDDFGRRRRLGKTELQSPENLGNQKVFRLDNATATGFSDGLSVDFEHEGQVAVCGGNKHWKTTIAGLKRLSKAKRLENSGSTLAYVRFIDDFPIFPLVSIWMDTGTGSFTDEKTYVVQTGVKALERCLLMTTDPGDLVLDPTCGSGTTAFVAEKWGRRWITCDTSRVAITLAKQRLMTASFDYYALRYPHEGLKGGFDYETVPHITLKSIANNPDIDTIHAEDHPKITAALASLNAALTAAPPLPFRPAQGVRKGKPISFRDGETMHEWEVPFDWPLDKDGKPLWPAAAHAPFDAFHTARQAMQRRMDASIQAHAEQETLYDKPRIDRNCLRITGPFSVEAVPAPTVLSLDDSLPPAEANDSIARTGETSRQSLWRDELLKTGVRAKGGARLTFAEFETLPGLRHLHASGSLTDTGERIVVSFGPEHAALEQRQVELALTEAETLRPAPKFILFCAFTFDPEAAKDIDEVNWPGVTLLKAQMNTDLLTEDLKKARSSNQSFWLMGQPDVELRKRKDGTWEVEVNGFDYFDPKAGDFDPKAGDLVSGGKKQIAMWSLDTDYDQRSLMPHQVFFPMADAKGGWNRLKATVRSELDEDLLEQFHGTVSLPFEAGDNRRIAVKIVDDRGIESLKIMPLED